MKSQKEIIREALNQPNAGPFGPFSDNPDDISTAWYMVAEVELEEIIKEEKAELEEIKKQKKLDKKEIKDIEIIKKNIQIFKKELSDLRGTVKIYYRLTEKFKHEKKILKQIENDWNVFNSSLFADWNRTQRMKLDSSLVNDKDKLAAIREETQMEKIRQERIARRFNYLLYK